VLYKIWATKDAAYSIAIAHGGGGGRGINSRMGEIHVMALF